MATPALIYAQDRQLSNVKSKDEPHRYSCREMEVTPDGKRITLKRNVKIETEKLTLSADSAVFTPESQTWIAYGTKELIFKGGEAVIQEKPGNMVRYKLGDKIIYFE